MLSTKTITPIAMRAELRRRGVVVGDAPEGDVGSGPTLRARGLEPFVAGSARVNSVAMVTLLLDR